MRGMTYKRATTGSSPQTGATNSYVQEALEIQASKRPPRAQPAEMPVTPRLPRVKPKHRRRP
jgi:hypothetical protein